MSHYLSNTYPIHTGGRRFFVYVREQWSQMWTNQFFFLFEIMNLAWSGHEGYIMSVCSKLNVCIPWNMPDKMFGVICIFECRFCRAAYLFMSVSRLMVQYIPRNMHTVFALLCFVVVIYWLIFPFPSGLLSWHCGNLTIAPVPAKQPWWIWINTSCESIMNDCITTTKQSTTKPCAYFLGYTVFVHVGVPYNGSNQWCGCVPEK